MAGQASRLRAVVKGRATDEFPSKGLSKRIGATTTNAGTATTGLAKMSPHQTGVVTLGYGGGGRKTGTPCPTRAARTETAWNRVKTDTPRGAWHDGCMFDVNSR
jgi:hypothetical protein